MCLRGFATGGSVGEATPRHPEKTLSFHVYVPDRSAAADAAELMTRFGDYAASEAAARADRSRDLGNLLHFCRWRAIERLIVLLAAGRGMHTIH
jgi:hypothetical protein